MIKFKSLSQFLLPSEGKSIIIPNGFGSSNCPILHCLYKEYKDNNKIYKINNKINITSKHLSKTYERYLFFCSIVYKSYIYSINYTTEYQYRGTQKNDESVPYVFFNMNSNSENSLVKKMGMSKSNVKKMIDFFIKYGFLTKIKDYKSYIDWKNPDDNKQKNARRFVVSDQFYRKSIKYYFQFEDVANSIKKSFERMNHLLSEEEYDLEFEKNLLNDDLIKRISFPSEGEVKKLADEMVKSKMVDKYGREYVYEIPKEWYHEDNGKIVTKKNSKGKEYSYRITNKLKEGCPYVNINHHINYYVQTLYGEKNIKKRVKTKDEEGFEYHGRFYYYINMLPKWIRNLIKIDNEELIEIDAQSLHPRIIGKIFNTLGFDIPDFLVGDSHNKIAKMLQIERNEAKLINLSYWNSKISKGKTIASKKNKKVFAKMDEFLKNEYPYLVAMLRYFKNNQKPIKGKYSHCNISLMLIHIEVEMMEKIIKIFNKPCLYVFDCLYVKKSDYTECKKIFDEIIDETLKIENNFVNCA